MSTPNEDPRVPHFQQQLDSIDLEIVRLAALCGVPFRNRDELRASLIRVLENDASVCGKPNPRAFTTLRAAITMHLDVRDRAIESMGRAQAMAIVDDVAARLGRRLGFEPPVKP